MNRIVPQESVDIVVSPQFYTDGILDVPAPVSYFVYKEGRSWVFIAYNMQEILDFLEQKGISPQNVRRIFFAQQLAPSNRG